MINLSNASTIHVNYDVDMKQGLNFRITFASYGSAGHDLTLLITEPQLLKLVQKLNAAWDRLVEYTQEQRTIQDRSPNVDS